MSPTATLLETWMKNGWLDSQCRDNESAITSQLAAGILPVANGLIAMASTSAALCQRVDAAAVKTAYALHPQIALPSQVATASYIWREGDKDWAEFGPRGLGLQVITLQAGLDKMTKRPLARLVLMIRNLLPGRDEGKGCVLISIDSPGTIRAAYYCPLVLEGSDHMRYLLGLYDAHRLALPAVSGPLDNVVGMKNAAVYFADALGRIGTSLTRLAGWQERRRLPLIDVSGTHHHGGGAQ